jgi:hypothetical protein
MEARDQAKKKTCQKCHKICQTDEPNSGQSPRTVLGPRNGVQVQVDADTIFTRPTKEAKDISANKISALFPMCRPRQGHCFPRPCLIPTSSTPSVRRALQARPQSPRTEWVNESSSTPPQPSRQGLAPSTNEYVQNKRRGGSALSPKTGERYGGRNGRMGRTTNVS